MKIRCWGARGSIPVSGAEYVKYGGDTTCIEIRNSDDDILIVDCGSGIRRLGNRLMQEKRRELSIVFTHAHWDHLSGFPFFKPIYHKETKISFHGCIFAQNSIKTILSRTMEAPFFPVDLSAVRAEMAFSDICAVPFSIGGMEVIPIHLSHPNMGFGYKFREQGKTFVFLTDNELDHQHPQGETYADYREFSRNADLLIHDAEYTDEEYRRTRTWGHTPYRRALALALDAGAKRLGLFHHNQERSDAALDAIVQECREAVAAKGSTLDCFALTQDTEIEL